MTMQHAWKVALFASLCAAVWPAGVKATNYTMTIQSIPAAGGKCVSAPNGQFAEGMHVLVWDCNSFLTQNLIYDDQSQELKFGTNCVEILGQGSAQDPVGIGKCNGAVTQRWSMAANGDNYQVIGVNSLCLNISNGVIANGTPLNLETCVPNKAVELWALYQASEAPANAQSAQSGNASKPGAADPASNPNGQPNNAPGQTASASDPNAPGSGGSSPGGGDNSPGGGSSSPGGGGSGPSGGGSGPSGGGSAPASALPSPIAILIGMLNPPSDGTGNPPSDQPPSMGPLMGPPTDNSPMNPGSNMTPASGGSLLPPNVCGLSPDGQLVQVNFNLPPPDPNLPTDTGQYCVSGGPSNGQCGNITVDMTSKTLQFCGNGVCTPPMAPGSKPPAGYSQALFGVPDSSPVLPCPTSTTASNDPMGGLGPPMMDVKTGQPTYRPRPGGSQMASLPVPQTITMAVPAGQTPLGGGASGTPNVCHPKPGMTSYSTPKPQNPCAPPKNSSPLNLKNKLASADPGAPMVPKRNDSPLKLKPSPGGTQMANANPCTTKDSVPACESKPPYLPWGGHGSATITVAGGKPCGIGWHDTGATILDNISVASHPSHGNISPKDKNVVIFTPAAGYKGQDSFTLSMREHNGGRRATLTVKVNVTIR